MMFSVARLRSGQAELMLVIALLICAFGLRMWDLGAPSIWHDESWSIRAIRDPIGTPDDKTPLVYYSLVHFLWRGAGETPLALRYGSVLLDVITIALAARIIREWAGWDTAILTVVMLGLSPLLWAYAREIRAYVGVPLLTLVLLWQTDKLLRPRGRFPWRIWGGVLVAELLLLYTHNLSVPVVVWLNVMVGGWWFCQHRWVWLRIWIVGQVVLLALYTPWLLSQPRSGSAINTPPTLDVSLVWNIWQGYFAPLPTLVGANQALMIGSAIFGLLALVSVATVVKWRWDRRTQLLLSQALLLPVFSTLEVLVAHIDFHPRYYIASVPATLMLVALGMDSLSPVFELRRLALPVAFAAVCSVGAASFPILLSDSRYQHDDFRAVADYYATLPEEAIILIPYGWEPALEVYYAEKVGIQAEIVGMDFHGDVATVIERINAALAQRDSPVHVEVLTWYQLPADLRGMYGCLLEAAGQRMTGPGFTVQGVNSTGYMIERPLAWVDVPVVQSDYGRITLDYASLMGARSVCLHTMWELQYSTRDDWRVSGRLMTIDPPGWIIARSDTDIRADDQTPTSQWQPEQRGDGFSLLRFPNGTPPGEYVVQVSVYSQAEPDGLDRLIDGVPAGRAVTVTTVHPVGTTDQAISTAAFDPVIVASMPAVQLTGHDAQAAALSAGQALHVTLQWQVLDACCRERPWTRSRVILRGADWEIAQPVAAYADYSLDWHTFVIPADAQGQATLRIEAETSPPVTLATYTIQQTERLFAPPAFEVPVQTEFTGLAWLEGFSVGQTTVATDETLNLTLVWRATRTPDTSYRVFTHLLDAAGRVIAQHDGFPVNETRLTTSWVPREYLIDPYTLIFDPERKDYQGVAHLEVGFYDPETGHRIRMANGADHIILPVEIKVQ